MKIKKVFWLILGIILILAVIGIAFFYFVKAEPRYDIIPIQNPINSNTNLSQLIIGEEHVAYVLNEIRAYKLHNPPLSSEKPIIEIDVDDSKFKADVDKGEVKVEKGAADNPDIKIITTREEMINALTSLDIKNYIKSSVSSEKTKLELVAGYVELFSKGYLSIYQDLTGKSFSGSVTKIFSQG